MDKKIFLGNLLLESKLITQEQFDTAIVRQQRTGERLGKILIDLNLISEDVMLGLLSKQLNIPFIDLKDYPIKPEDVRLLPEFYARRYRAIVLSNDSTGLLVGMSDPLDLIASDELTKVLKRPFKMALVREEDLIQVVDGLYRHSTQIHNLAEELSAELKVSDFDIAQLGAGLPASDAPVVKLLQTIFEDAVQVSASDIHIEPDETILRIRFRVDGALQEQIVKEKHIAAALTLRLKLMSGLNIAEKRMPQDGRFSLKIRNLNYDVRLSTLPVQFGESVVMRLLNQSAELVSLDNIGMPEQILRQFKKIIRIPNGLILVTGPTGSGKTTTLYSALAELNKPDVKIITVEDPVEYRLPRISQVQVQPKLDLTFARVLRSALRQDPDIVMVGELRDAETTSIALRAALTGHLVMATVHTNDSVSSITRLIDMGAPEYLIAAVLHAVMAQRLVRKICVKCIKPYQPTTDEIMWLQGVGYAHILSKPLMHGAGCNYCNKTGYFGRTGVYEYLKVTPELFEILKYKKADDFDQEDKKRFHYKSLLESGLELVLSSVTTIEEIYQITGEDITSNSAFSNVVEPSQE